MPPPHDVYGGMCGDDLGALHNIIDLVCLVRWCFNGGKSFSFVSLFVVGNEFIAEFVAKRLSLEDKPIELFEYFHSFIG